MSNKNDSCDVSSTRRKGRWLAAVVGLHGTGDRCFGRGAQVPVEACALGANGRTVGAISLWLLRKSACQTAKLFLRL